MGGARTGEGAEPVALFVVFIFHLSRSLAGII